MRAMRATSPRRRRPMSSAALSWRMESAVKQIGRTDWRSLRRIADRGEEPIRRALIKAIVAAQNGTSSSRLRQALERGDIEGAAAAVPWERLADPIIKGDLLSRLRDVYEQSAVSAAQILPVVGNMFTIANPRVGEWIREQSAARVVQISADTRAGIMRSLTNAAESGWSATRTANLIKPQIGLHDAWADAVSNRAKEWAEAGKTQESIDREVVRYSNQLRQARALNIARTESTKANSAGQREAWAQAVDDGLMDQATATRVWIMSPGACPACQALDGQEVGLDEPFVGDDGEQYDDAGDPHPSCRCAVSVRP